MGVDFNGLKMLSWSKNLGVKFDRALTLGHQGFFCTPDDLRKTAADFDLKLSKEEIQRSFQHPTFGGIYVDELFRCLGAKEVVSVDKSDFENATLLHDLNKPFPPEHQGRYDFVFDGGTLEHIFDYPVALRNTLQLVRLGGHFLTIPPAHNFMGHGFYQISPELFFRVLSPENGFILRKLVIFDASKKDAPFFQVHDPAASGHRTDLRSSKPMCLAALAQRATNTPILQRPPQQSDYAAIWDKHRNSQAAKSGSVPNRLTRLRRALNPYWPVWLLKWKNNLLLSWRGGSAKLSNKENFRRLSYAEICRERGEAMKEMSPGQAPTAG